MAEFRKDGKEHEAWYEYSGCWIMTEIDYGRNLSWLPQTVRDGYGLTSYATGNWTVEDIDEIQRPEYETIYRIEVEKPGQPDYDLYFDLGGTLFREVPENGGGSGTAVPQPVPGQIAAFIDSVYRGATVIDFEVERDGYEVDIRHDGTVKEVRFGSDYAWALTSTDCLRNIPETVRAAVERLYPGKRIDDCDFVEEASGESYWLVDLDGYGADLKVAADGTVTETPGR